ncbi:hypothetical protein OIU78_006018 [Salix suchowensis]|nr:hypothetical protein OIU78_006018 [Salix suchowensis]
MGSGGATPSSSPPTPPSPLPISVGPGNLNKGWQVLNGCPQHFHWNDRILIRWILGAPASKTC